MVSVGQCSAQEVDEMKRKRIWGATVVFLVSAAIVLSVNAVPATILTNTGTGGVKGDLIGLGAILRLIRPTNPPLVGPDVQYDVPLSAIRQITFDFPRVIIETATAEMPLIGPFSAFQGLAETLTFNPSGNDGSVELPTTALRAIALNGHELRSVPRAWLGTQFLTEPRVTSDAGSPSSLGSTGDAACTDCTIDTSAYESAGDETPIWNTITPTLQPDDADSSLPWWAGLLGVALVVGIFYFISTGQG